MTRYLIENRANLNQVDNNGTSVLMEAIKKGKNILKKLQQ